MALAKRLFGDLVFENGCTQKNVWAKRHRQLRGSVRVSLKLVT